MTCPNRRLIGENETEPARLEEMSESGKNYKMSARESMLHFLTVCSLARGRRKYSIIVLLNCKSFPTRYEVNKSFKHLKPYENISQLFSKCVFIFFTMLPCFSSFIVAVAALLCSNKM